MKYLDWLFPVLHLLIGGAIAYPAFMNWWQRLRKPHLEDEIKQRHRPLAEAKLAAMYKEQLGESLLLDGANKVWEEETVFKESNDHYEWVVILQNREGQYFWFRYLSNAPALFKETSLSIVNVLTKGKDIPPPHHSEPTEVKA